MDNYDFDLNPPLSVSVEVFDWDSDLYGNPTAHFLLMWSNGKTGADYAGGTYRTSRREQTGYSDKTSESALQRLADLFTRTRWKVQPDSMTGDRAGRSASFQAVRDFDSEPVPVIFRAVKSGDHIGTVDAFFPTLMGTNDPHTCTVYTHVGQHCTGSRDYYKATRPATPEEVAPLKRELESGPFNYRLEVRKAWTQEFDAIRHNAHRQRGAA
jgi:hypothetical protein